MAAVPDDEPLDRLLDRWKAGDRTAGEAIYRRYAERLAAKAERLIGSQLRPRLEADDVVQSVFRTLFRRTQLGEYQVDHSGELWNLLVTIAINKIRKAARRSAPITGLNAEHLAHEPTEEEAAAFVDELEVLCIPLEPEEREMVRLFVEGDTCAEIALRLGSSRWTVRRLIARVGRHLQRRRDESTAG